MPNLDLLISMCPIKGPQGLFGKTTCAQLPSEARYRTLIHFLVVCVKEQGPSCCCVWYVCVFAAGIYATRIKVARLVHLRIVP